jgi:flagellin-like hook-associated protein FlgL
MGALQNRLEHAYNINSNTAENTQRAESQLRDADMAEEIVTYSKHSILEQAGQAMLAQANQNMQGILALLQ